MLLLLVGADVEADADADAADATAAAATTAVVLLLVRFVVNELLNVRCPSRKPADDVCALDDDKVSPSDSQAINRSINQPTDQSVDHTN